MHRSIQLCITRCGTEAAVADPAFVVFDAAMFGADTGEARQWRLTPPAGWRLETVLPEQWRAYPEGFNPDLRQKFVLTDAAGDDHRHEIEVIVSLDLRSSFDAKQHALKERNNASALGRYDPRPDVFERTYSRMPHRFGRMLFGGLYADIVFLRSDNGSGGGLCTGMAHWAIARGKGQEPDPASLPDAVERIALYHGRQLRDRALLASLAWFLRASPRAAFHAVRDDLLREGYSDRALDVGVPKPWRLDVVHALIRTGHTVVPYRVCQVGRDRGYIEVYDPNRPEAIDSGDPRVIEFDLQRDRYSYRTLSTMEKGDVGMIAVRQSAYEGGGTAILATIGSAVVHPGRSWAALRGSPRSERDDARTSSAGVVDALK